MIHFVKICLKQLASIIFIISIVTGVYLPQKSYGQNKTETADSTEIKEITPYNISNLAEEFETTSLFLNTITKNLKPDENEFAIDSLMPKAFNNLQELYKDPKVKDFETLTIKNITILKKDFIQIRSQLEEWRDFLQSESKKLKPLKDKLETRKKRWEKTLQMAQEQKLPQENIQRIVNLTKDINKHIKSTRKRNGELFAKQDKLTEKIILIHETIVDIDIEIKRYEKSEIFTIDSPPLWQEFGYSGDTTSIETKLTAIWEQYEKNYQKFWHYNSDNFKIHMILTIFFIIILFLFKNHIKKWSEDRLDTSLNASLHIIFNPLSTSLLLSLLLAGVFYPDFPSVKALSKTLMLIPLMVILPGIVPDIRKRFLYVFVILVLLTRAATLVSDLTILTRFIYLAINIIAIITIWPVIKPGSKMKQFRSGSWWNFGLFINKLAFIGFSISIISNIVGNVVLTVFLTDSGISAIFWGVLFYVLVIVLESLIALIMQTDLASATTLVKQYPDEVVKHTRKLIRTISFFIWLAIVAKSLIVYDLITDWLTGIFTNSFSLGTLSISIGSILSFFIAIWVSFTIARFIRFILEEEVLTHFNLPRGVPGAIGMITRLIIIVFGFIVAFGLAGIDFSNIALIFGALGVGIGFGLQSIFNNLVSGLILAFERPIQVKDIIQIASLNLMGEVKEIGFRASTIRTFDGAEVIVPNGNLIANEMINWTLSDKRRRQEILVGVEYGSDLKKILKVLNTTVSNHENVMKNPGPLMIFNGFGDSSLNFRVLFWTHFDVGLTTKSAVGIAIDEALKAAGITIPFPQTDLHVRSIDDDVKKILTPNKRVNKTVETIKKPSVSKKPTSSKTNISKDKK